MRRWVTWITLVCFITTQTAAVAGPFEEGTAAGQAANPVIRGTVNTPSASSAVPGYTTTPPETTYYGQPSLSGAANARLAACATSTDDPVCQAQRGAVTSANTPRAPVSAYDPAVAAARDIAGNPSSVLGSLADYYSGCTTAEVTTPAGTTTKVCNRYSGVGNYTTRRDLTVQVELLPSCAEGTWFAHGQVNRNGMDYMIAEAQCRIRADGLQRFRFYAAGGMGACIGWQALDLPTAPATQADLRHRPVAPLAGLLLEPLQGRHDAGLGLHRRELQLHLPVRHAGLCLPRRDGARRYLSGYWAAYSSPVVRPTNASRSPPPMPMRAARSAARRSTTTAGMHCAVPAGTATLVGASGWSLPLSFVQPTMEQHETDVWVDRSASLTEGGRCTVTTADRCVDGPATKTIDGRAVTRACWSYERTLTCAAGAPVDECAPLASSGCTPATSTCKQMNAATGLCEITQDTYTCPVAAQTATTASNCPANVYCLGSNCFNTSYTNDADFARSMSLMEAAREAGVYLDTTNMQVFKGESNKCRDRLFKNCCYSDSAGAGMTNQSLFGTGSRLVYDVLMNADNREFLYQGMQALLMSGGFSGSFTTYGVTVAINGTALPAGSAVLYSGDGLVIAFDPWSLAIAVVIYIVMSMSSCNEEEGKLAMKEGAGLCHSVGTYCSSCIRILGACVACIEHTTGKCCFNSKLARIVNEQGRVQVGKGWGSGENPDCSGFSIAQLQSLDFAAMDLSEFYASIVPTLPSVGTIQGSNASRLTTCYYGQGRCQ
ncbi:MAG: type-F conjugative transfer system mating-pair stabilization protein TraN [Candidatus Accumulibacter necessarius]|jgi:conjugal transfer mating pair stabilization protein TraN